MEIVRWDLERAAALAGIYNEQAAGLPYCYPVSPDEFAAGAGWARCAIASGEELRAEQILVCRRGDEITGFAHIAMGQRDSRGRPQGLIRFLTYRPGYRPAGQALLERSEGILMQEGAAHISAFAKPYGYTFYYLGFGMVSDRLGHILGLFGINGYYILSGEVFLDWRDYPAVCPLWPCSGVEALVRPEPTHGDRPGITVEVRRDGQSFGECRCVSVGQYCRDPLARECLFTTQLWVEESDRGKGWGRYLLQRALWEMRRVGYRTAVISTDWRNYRALLLYTNHGYRVLDTAYHLVKDVELVRVGK